MIPFEFPEICGMIAVALGATLYAMWLISKPAKRL